ncbi:hypothetical protein ZHAS_00005699 [Anopheles sinensis]|uniref:Uncharacterized protein n=1 Tax=Anopheles sinensis TaxID=74873 RepID=A0A084VK52_ANOSI|nr:hypothetical protein ZHAS_00005699 [Anopheles sinensis]
MADPEEDYVLETILRHQLRQPTMPFNVNADVGDEDTIPFTTDRAILSKYLLQYKLASLSECDSFNE